MAKSSFPPFALHVCCAPCLIGTLHTIRSQNPSPLPAPARIIFYNPNIHPLLEFRRRQKALRVYLERDPLPSEIDDGYGLRIFLDRVLSDPKLSRRDRCRRCYRLRLDRTAELCRQYGLEAFSTTLLASREQDRDLVAAAGFEAADKYGLTFLEADLRGAPPDGKMLRGIYKQQYCGCIFSEEERFRDTKKHVYRENDPGDGDG